MAFDEEEIDDIDGRRRFKRIRTSVTLLLLVGVVVGASWYSLRNVVGPDDEPTTAPAGEPCVPRVPTAPPAPADIQVNVYNATDRPGLASNVARQMRERGFVVVEIDNDPLRRTIAGTAEVRSHPDQQGAAGVITAMVSGASYITDNREAPVVDLVLGEAFEALLAPGAPAAETAADLPPCPAPAG